MLARLLVAGLVALAFGAGYYVGMPDPEAAGRLADTIATLEEERERLGARNTELEETLGLVKRQIQTDRIAYDNLQRSVEASDRERRELEEKLTSQRELLERIKKRLEE